MKRFLAVSLSLLICLLTTVFAWASPATGDNSHMGLWIAMVGAAIVAVAAILILLRKKK